MSTNELFLGHTVRDSEAFHIDRDDLTTHGLVVGRTGSGKTGLIHVLIEEAVMAGASAVILDPKGDLTNLMLSFPGLTPNEFAPWVPPGKSPVQEAARWAEGLKSTGQNVSRVAEWRNAASFNVYTPGLAGTAPINLLPDFDPPAPGTRPAIARASAARIVETVLSLLGDNSDPLTDPAHVFLTDLMLSAWNRGENFPLAEWSGALVNPPESMLDIDGISLEDFFPHRDRMKLARSIVGFRRQAARWLEGTPLNMNSFLMPTSDGQPRVSIFTLNHLLSDDDRMLFTSMFLSGLVNWMRAAPASGRLRALCVLDEATGYLPPTAKPPTKEPICRLLAQGRSQGLGVLLGIQNPNDLDYKAVSNIDSWFLGGLRERDLKRDLEAELRRRGIDSGSLTKTPTRSFMALTKNGKSQAFRVRWPLSYLRGPLDSSQLAAIATNCVAEPVEEIKAIQIAPSKPNHILYGAVDVAFDLIDADSGTFDVTVRYSKDDGRTWVDATPDESSNEMTDLPSSPVGIRHSFIWDSVADLGYNRVPGVRLAVCVHGKEALVMPPADVCNNVLMDEEPAVEELDGNY